MIVGSKQKKALLKLSYNDISAPNEGFFLFSQVFGHQRNSLKKLLRVHLKGINVKMVGNFTKNVNNLCMWEHVNYSKRGLSVEP